MMVTTYCKGMKKLLLCISLAAFLGVGAQAANNASAPAKGRIVIEAENIKFVEVGGAKTDKDKPRILKEETEISTGMQRIDNFLSLHEHVGKATDALSGWFQREKFNILILFGGLLATFLVSVIFNWMFRTFFVKLLASRTDTEVDDMVCEAVQKPTTLLIFSIGIFLSSILLLQNLEREVFELIFRCFIALMAFSIVWGFYRLIAVFDFFLRKLSARTDNNLDDLLVNLIRKALKITVVVIAILFIGQSILGINITALLAGAGVIGLAVAFAAKDTIANFFGSVMIILDKPFAVGERIKVGGIDGIVENVGFRSTRIRSLDGHLYSMPNSKVADNVVENVSKRPFIKHAFSLTLVYDTPPEKLERAMQILHELLDSHEGFDMEERPPRIYFNAFNDWALNVSVTLWFQTIEWYASQQWLSDLNMEILRRFNGEGIEFAFPTSTTYLAGDPNRKLVIENTEASET
jgi:MscS family membrane protein